MASWWQLGEGSGHFGNDLALYRIECPFCGEKGNFETEHHSEKKKPNSRKKLNFDTLKCGNCSGYVLVMWSANESYSGPNSGIHDFRVLPWPQGTGDGSENWPVTVTRFWKQAHSSLDSESYDAAAMTSRSALQAVMRQQGAVGSDLKAEINDLGEKGILPTILVDWSHELRELANESAHPETEGDKEADDVDPADAGDLVEYLDYLLEYVYDMPARINRYRSRRMPEEIKE